MKRMRLLPCLIALNVLLGGCGDRARDEPAPKARAPVVRARPPVPVVSPMERARFHLDRLLTGPSTTGTLNVPEVHRRSLELSLRELVVLRDEALELLSDERLRTRLQEGHLRNLDPWHNVLSVLKALEGVPFELLQAWVEPALRSPLLTLRRAAARALSTLRDPELAPLQLAFLEQDGADREIGRGAFLSLVGLGPRWRRAAVLSVLRTGAPRLWESLPDRVGSLVPTAQRDADIASLLASFAALAQGSGPCMDEDLPRIKEFPWSALRLSLDPSLELETVPGRRSGGDEEVTLHLAQGPLDVWQAYGTGWLAVKPTQCQVQPVFATYLSGGEAAAQARCVLALWGDRAYVHSVLQDRTLKGIDDAIYFAALHCMGVGERPTAEVLPQVEALVQALAGGTPVDPQQISRLVRALPPCDEEPRAQSALLSLLRVARPVDVYRTALEDVYDTLARCHQERRAAVEALLKSDAADDLGAGLHLVRRARDPEYLGTLHALLDAAGPGLRQTLERLLLFLYARSYPVDPLARERFVAQVQSWIEGAPEAELSSLASGLLDLGPAGEAAFVRGLEDPARRRLYLGAVPDDGRVLAPMVAEALIDGLDDNSPREELELVLVRGYAGFPLQAASALKALKERLSPSTQNWVETVLEQVLRRSAH